MDLLGQYSDSDAEGQEEPSSAERPAGRPAQPSATTQRRNAAPEDDDAAAGSSHQHLQQYHHQQNAPVPPAASLFNPFASSDSERPASNASASPSSGGGGGGGGKRGFVQVTGSGPIQDAPPKASRTASKPAGPKPAFNTALVPPQLRNGRANVSTEDVEKIFSKDTLAKRRPK